jgi:hypothetical protein
MEAPHKAVEIWKPVVGYPQYEVSTHGRIKRVAASCGTKQGKVLNPWHKKNGYLAVGLSVDCKVVTKLVHRLVAEAWIGDVAGLDVCHNNGVRDDNRVENLRIDTRQGNMKDVVKHDTHIRGERCGTNKYAESMIRELKKEIAQGKVLRQLAEKYGMPATTVYGIADGRTWGWL